MRNLQIHRGLLLCLFTATTAIAVRPEPTAELAQQALTYQNNEAAWRFLNGRWRSNYTNSVGQSTSLD